MNVTCDSAALPGLTLFGICPVVRTTGLSRKIPPGLYVTYVGNFANVRFVLNRELAIYDNS